MGTFWGKMHRNGQTYADRNGQLNQFDEISEKSLKLSEILTEPVKLPTATRCVRESLSAHSNLHEKVLVYRAFSFFGDIFGEICSLQQKNDPERDDRNALDRNWNDDIIPQKKRPE